MKMPLFPLPIFLLPQGVTRLRIIEPRYLKLVTIASQHHGFVIVSNSPIAALSKGHWGSWVEVINFDQEDAGVLTIDVRCNTLVQFEQSFSDGDGLSHANVVIKSHWPAHGHDDVSKKLSQSLQLRFENSSELSQLYQGQFIDLAPWVLSRWIELLPVALAVKTVFLEANSFSQAKHFLQEIVLSEIKET